jgi:excisionase family DNA binding protein
MAEPESLELRIAKRLTQDGCAIVSPRMARWLERELKMTADRRILMRDSDPEAYEVFVALHFAATGFRSDLGTNHAAGQPDQAQLKAWISTGDAADEIGVTDRCIRKWCNTGRLPATWSGNRWWINRNDITVHKLTA